MTGLLDISLYNKLRSVHLFFRRRSCKMNMPPTNLTTTEGAYSNLITANRDSLRLPASYHPYTRINSHKCCKLLI